LSGEITGAALRGPLRLRGRVKESAWGKVGTASRIFPMAPQTRADAPLAEFWIGSHPQGPAHVELDDGSLLPFDAVLRQHARALLGERCVERFGEQLPFMMKVLSVHKDHGLSIQLHPTREQARGLRLRAPEHYPDDNHKPEVGIALTQVSLLYGCKSLRELQGIVKALPGMKSFLERDLVTRVENAPPDSPHDVGLVREVFTSLLRLKEDRVAECVAYLQGSLPQALSLSKEFDIFRRLVTRYGMRDVGLIALVCMNQVVLQPGEAVFIAPNVPHAYLEGDLFECMACSDNVVRAGLTPKFKDLSALIELVDCSHSPEGGRPVVVGSGQFSAVKTPTEEFCVRVMNHGVQSATIHGGDGPGVILCVGEGLSVRSRSTGKALELADGGAAFIPADSGEYEVLARNAAVFYVTPSIPQNQG